MHFSNENDYGAHWAHSTHDTTKANGQKIISVAKNTLFHGTPKIFALVKIILLQGIKMYELNTEILIQKKLFAPTKWVLDLNPILYDNDNSSAEKKYRD